jgi:hypothetical protein
MSAPGRKPSLENEPHPMQPIGDSEVLLAYDDAQCGAAYRDGTAATNKKPAPVSPGRVHITPPQSAASAAFSVALGRIAADVLAGSGR